MSRPATLRLARSARLLHRCSPTVRLLHTTTTRYDVSPGTTASAAPTSRNTESSGFWKEWSSSAAFQAALTTVVGLGMVFTAGIGYLEWYKGHVLHRVSRQRYFPADLPDVSSVRAGLCELNHADIADGRTRHLRCTSRTRCTSRGRSSLWSTASCEVNTRAHIS